MGGCQPLTKVFHNSRILYVAGECLNLLISTLKIVKNCLKIEGHTIYRIDQSEYIVC